jgi:hypothetical protein
MHPRIKKWLTYEHIPLMLEAVYLNASSVPELAPHWEQLEQLSARKCQKLLEELFQSSHSCVTIADLDSFGFWTKYRTLQKYILSAVAYHCTKSSEHIGNQNDWNMWGVRYQLRFPRTEDMFFAMSILCMSTKGIWSRRDGRDTLPVQTWILNQITGSNKWTDNISYDL